MNDDPAIFLKPGEVMVAVSPTIITTLLGSCVAVTMFTPRLKLGGICHVLLPVCRRERDCDRCQEAGKFVPCAIGLMLKEMTALGVTRGEIEAKIFGGADMFDSEMLRNSVGRQNIEMALSTLESESIRVVTRDLGGKRGRKIVFFTGTGEVLLKRLRKTEMQP
ncbi:MAG TPA: chemotaxis protein CheD [Geomonas sp.]|nr:chemotaxis protein CheD [Geomonas sp.]